MPPPPSGILAVSSLPLGEFDECLSIESPEEPGKPRIVGQYCRWGPAFPLPPRGSYKIGEPIDPYVMDMMKNSTDKRIINLRKYINGLDQEKVDQLFYELEYSQSYDFKTGGSCLPTTCKPKDVEYAINKCRKN